MTSFLDALGGKLAERWLTLLVVPAALVVCVAAAGLTLGQQRWYDLGILATRIDELSTGPALRNTGSAILLLAVLLATSTSLGLAVTAAGGAVERVWLGTRPRILVARRLRRWDAAQTQFDQALLDAAAVDHAPGAAAAAARARELNARRNRIALVPPTRPFWLGDRIAAVDNRVWATYRLDLTSAWPRLWLTLPEDARAEISTARARLAATARLVVWSAILLAIGVVWWPAAAVGVGTAATAWHRARVAATSFAELAESAVDLHGRKLAEALGLPCPGPLTAEAGAEISVLLRKGS